MLVGCVIMASGVSKRFGENKLLVDFHGEMLIEKVLALTEGNLFAKRIVVTRTKEVAELCRERGIEVILHEFPGRGDAVRLGVEQMMDMNCPIDGCLFCPCDQPLLKKESLEKMIEEFRKNAKGIVQLCYGSECGAPMLFSKEYFEELCHLPEKKGGSYVAKKYPEAVKFVEAQSELELQDIDTREEYKKLLLY